MWKCKGCGKCCTFIIIPVQKVINSETEEYLEAHGILYEDGKLHIPARCKYLTSKNRCAIHKAKFPNCAAGGEQECKEAQKGWSLLNSK